MPCPKGEHTVYVFHDTYGKKQIPLEVEDESTSMRIRLESPSVMIIEDEKQTDAITRHVVTAEELKRVPGTFGDPVRALQSLPGVARPNVAEGSIVVRGAEGINTGFYVDGMPVPYMFHTMVGRSVIILRSLMTLSFREECLQIRRSYTSVVNVRTDTLPTEGQSSVAIGFPRWRIGSRTTH